VPWFKVDDGLFLHQKIVKAGNAAMGLWLRAGSWSAHHLTEGFVPDTVIEVLGTPTQRAKLISVGLWAEADGGCRFHEWNERQPTRDEVTEQRSAWAARKRKSRDSAREKSFSEDFAGAEKLESSASSQVNEECHAPVTAPRPVPSLTTEEQQTPTGSVARSSRLALAVQPPLLDVVTDAPPPAPPTDKARGTRLSEDWRPSEPTIAWSRQMSGEVDITAEWSKFQDYWLSRAGAGARKTDWDRTWKNWLRKALDDSRRRGPTRTAAPSARAQRLAHSVSIVEKFAAEEAAQAALIQQRRAIQA
jgi:hypothetical protein